jgi:hypothetical protein
LELIISATNEKSTSNSPYTLSWQENHLNILETSVQASSAVLESQLLMYSISICVLTLKSGPFSMLGPTCRGSLHHVQANLPSTALLDS